MTGAASRRIALVSNPTAGKGRGLSAGAVVARTLTRHGHRVVDLSGESAHEALDRARAAVADGVDALVVVGGDGMVHLGFNACAGTGVPLGVVAVGTGNDVARNAGLPTRDTTAAAVHITEQLEAGGRLVDAVRVTPDRGDVTGPSASGSGGRQTWFGGVLGAGFDAVVNERANGWAWPRGRMRYNLAIARELPMFRPISYALTLDGVREELDAMLVAVANSSSYGGGMRIAPDAAMDDGLLDVFVLAPLGTLEFVRVFPTVFSGTHVSHRAVSIRRARTVHLETLDVAVVGYADGERVAPLPLRCEVVPGAVRLLAPSPASNRPGVST